jgi:cytochrome c-type biogenesis protein CcsB
MKGFKTMKHKIQLLISLMLVAFSLVYASESRGAVGDAIKELPVQDAGRIKPLDTFARESLQLIYGRQTFKNERGGTRPALEVMMTWLMQPQAWGDTPLFEINHNQVKKALKFEAGRKYFTLNEIMKNERLPVIMQELQSKRETKEKLDPYFQALQRLENQLFTFREIAAGRMLKLVPQKDPAAAWTSAADLQGDLQKDFVQVTKDFVGVIGIVTGDTKDQNQARQNLDTAVAHFEDLARAQAPENYPSARTMKIEVHYNTFHPFQKAWIFYLLAMLAALASWSMGSAAFQKWTYVASWTFALLGLLMHVYGFGLRVYLMGRPPVSNMYETVIWVAFGAVVFSMIIEAVYRWRFILMAGTMVGAFCLIVGDMAPAVLDSSLQPLEPVLRSNYWLLIHVLTITISYAAFFLAFALGDIGLIYYLRGEEKNRERIKALVLAVYRAMQIGVSFLAPGIILGGIWADYSWGRFWGWDPKETWALIVLLGYMAVLHGRLAKWIKDFGMVCAGVVTFSLVIMAWYGVNFVLGAGLHSYGFGAGGVQYVATFVALHLLFVVFVSVVRWGRLKEKPM